MNDKSHDNLTSGPENVPESFSLPFPSSELEQLGIRVTRAEFARLMGCSRQAVTDWVNGGRVVVGPDGRFDPRQAVRSLLATGNPSRLRARVLQPLYDEMAQLRSKIVTLELGRIELEESVCFHEESAEGVIAIFGALQEGIDVHWETLAASCGDTGKRALLAWLDAALENGVDTAPTLAEFLRSAVPASNDVDKASNVVAGLSLADIDDEDAQSDGPAASEWATGPA